MRDRSQAQIILDVMFEVLSRCHMRDQVPADREAMMEFARDQLRKCGVDVRPMGLSHAVLREAGPSQEDEALSFIMSDFEFLHAGPTDRMARVKRFMDMVGMKMVRK